MLILTQLYPVPVQHPVWCDPRTCETDPHADCDGEVYVTHRAVLLDERSRSVEVVQTVSMQPDGSRPDADEPLVRVCGAGDAYLTAAEAARLAGAIVDAASAAGGAAGVLARVAR